MPNINQMFPSKYLKAGDLQGQEVVVTILGISFETVGENTKPILAFAGKNKGLVLNVTNGRTIGGLHGEETDGWIGKSIILGTAWVDFQGNTVEAIRVRPVMPNITPQQQGMAAQAPVAAPTQAHDSPTTARPAATPADYGKDDMGVDLEDNIPF